MKNTTTLKGQLKKVYQVVFYIVDKQGHYQDLDGDLAPYYFDTFEGAKAYGAYRHFYNEQRYYKVIETLIESEKLEKHLRLTPSDKNLLEEGLEALTGTIETLYQQLDTNLKELKTNKTIMPLEQALTEATLKKTLLEKELQRAYIPCLNIAQALSALEKRQ